MNLLKPLFDSVDFRRKQQSAVSELKPSSIFVDDSETAKQIRFDYGCFESRWRSFPFWLDVACSSFMAEAGFFYDEPLDTVECFHCRQSVQSWKNVIQPHNKSLAHLHATNCRFIRRGESSKEPANLPNGT